MSKVLRILNNFSGSLSENLINLFRNKKDANELLSSTAIIKKMRIGISYLSEDNKSNYLTEIFGSEFTHSAIQFVIEMPGNKTTGVLVQYGRYEYIKKDKYGKEINNIGFPYKEGGGLVFGEMDDMTFQENFCSVGEIPLILTKNHPKISLKKFLKDVTKESGPWDFKSYDPVNKSCQEFVVASLKIIKPNFSYSQVKLKENMKIPLVIEDELKKHEI